MPAQDAPAGARLATLDLVRGVAVLGIVAVNMAGFAGPIATTDTPALAVPPQAGPAGMVDEALFALTMLLVEGKMRALFSMLFGASMLLFVERAELRGRSGEALQMRRLFWLGAFGYAHYVLLWWGDILFLYALCGLLALALRGLAPRAQVGLAVALFMGWHGWGMIGSLPQILAEEHVRTGIATAREAADVQAALAQTLAQLRADVAQAALGFWPQAAAKLADAPAWPLVMTLYTIGETLPLMLIGMALYASGFFTGHWPARWHRAVLWAGAAGAVWTGVLLGWAWPRHFPPLAMPDVLSYWAGPAHLAMALAYASLLVRAAPCLLGTGPGRRLVAAGRMAFSNYLCTSLAMCFLFNGWGLGWMGHVGRAGQAGLVLLVWAAMLGWSQPWLARFRQGPLEWLWRSLTEGRPMPFARPNG